MSGFIGDVLSAFRDAIFDHRTDLEFYCHDSFWNFIIKYLFKKMVYDNKFQYYYFKNFKRLK